MRWTQELAVIDSELQLARERVAQERGDAVATQATLFGYSQGASRAQALAALYPTRYPWVILGGPPTAPRADLLRDARAVFVFGGTLEPTQHMKNGTSQLLASGLRARFELLSGSRHGQFPPETGQLLLKAVRWLHSGQ